MFETILRYGQQFTDGITPTANQRKTIEEKTRLQSNYV